MDSDAHKRLEGVENVSQFDSGHFRVVGRLCPQPIARTEPQHTTQTQIRVGRDCPLARDDFADARCGYPDGLGQSVLADAQWFEELFLKKFPRADGWETIHGEVSVVVNKFNVFRVAV
jgi:hypothetical protein